MRKIDLIVVHCTATPAGRNVSVADIRAWHIARGFADIGYHYIIALDGTVEPGRDISIAGAHARGYTAQSVGVCYVGGLDASGNPASELLCGYRQDFPTHPIRPHSTPQPNVRYSHGHVRRQY